METVWLLSILLSSSSAKLGGGSKTRKLQISDQECYTNTQRLSIYAFASDPTYLLDECEGDCDNDSDCHGEMICFQRDAFGYVPSCGGGSFEPSNTDYCIHPGALSELQFCGSDPSEKLAQCQGDCDEDTDCKGDLVCFQRDSYTDVPGCTGGRVDSSNTDFCVKPSDLDSLGPLPEIKFLAADPIELLGRCEGDCDTDEDCEGDLVCFQRSDCMYTPGCDGGFNDYSRTDYCVRRSDVSAGKLSLEITSDFPLQLCQGDCDSNSDCAPGLICQQRDANEEVIGCIGGENDNSRTDYCISPNNRGNHRKSVLDSSLGEDLRPYNEQAMEWLINVDIWVPPVDEDKPRELWRERYAMAALYFSTEGDKWFDPRNYLSTTDSVCLWSGYGDEIEVYCDDNGRVLGVIGRENGMLGSLPPAMQALTMLRRIDFYHNNIRGSIPSELGLLTHLTRIDLYENNLTGSIPKELGSLTHLEQIALFDNALTGSLPESIGAWTNLQELSVNMNAISGSIPDIGALTKLSYLELSNNRMTGTLSHRLANLRHLAYFFLSHNRFSGSIPGSMVGSMTSLAHLDLSFNKIQGSIPTEIGRLSSIGTINFSYNDLEGSIPSEIGLLDHLYDFSLRGNELSGSLPSEMVNMSCLGDFDARTNNLSGDIPPLPSYLTNCQLENNSFSDRSNAEGICNFG